MQTNPTDVTRQSIAQVMVKSDVDTAAQSSFATGKVPATSKKTGAGKARQQADIAALENELSESLGTRVSVVHGRSGKGRLVIHYSGLDTLDGVLERLRAKA